MPSQSRSEGESTWDHFMMTESPDRFRFLGEIDKVALALAEETKIETNRMKVEKSTIMAIKCDGDGGKFKNIVAGESETKI